MKLVEATVAPFELEELKFAVRDAGASGVTATEVAWLGTSPAELAAGRRLRVKLEAVVHDDLVDRVIDAIERVVRRRPGGTALVFVRPVAEALRIRTGAIDEAAIA